MKYIKELTQNKIYELDVGEYFVYDKHIGNKLYYQKGLKISHKFMIPIGLTCESLENALKEY